MLVTMQVQEETIRAVCLHHKLFWVIFAQEFPGEGKTLEWPTAEAPPFSLSERTILAPNRHTQ